MRFQPEEEAHRFYDKYSKDWGFGYRINQRRPKSERDPRDVEHTSIYLECKKRGEKKSKKGKKVVPVKKQRAIIRCKCPAFIKFKLDGESEAFKIKEWNDEHNHPMVDPHMRHLMKSNRLITPV